MFQTIIHILVIQSVQAVVHRLLTPNRRSLFQMWYLFKSSLDYSFSLVIQKQLSNSALGIACCLICNKVFQITCETQPQLLPCPKLNSHGSKPRTSLNFATLELQSCSPLTCFDGRRYPTPIGLHQQLQVVLRGSHLLHKAPHQFLFQGQVIQPHPLLLQHLAALQFFEMAGSLVHGTKSVAAHALHIATKLTGIIQTLLIHS